MICLTEMLFKAGLTVVSCQGNIISGMFTCWEQLYNKYTQFILEFLLNANVVLSFTTSVGFSPSISSNFFFNSIKVCLNMKVPRLIKLQQKYIVYIIDDVNLR